VSSTAVSSAAISSTGPELAPPATDEDGPTIIPAQEWRETQARHQEKVDFLTREHRDRAGRQLHHPVEDFLFTYYSFRPAQLRRWHPGVGIALADAPERRDWRFHRVLAGPPADCVTVDPVGLRRARGPAIEFIHRLLSATSNAPGQFGCFGLHEWAMVYRQDDAARRHQQWPLRLGQAGTDDVVREHQIRCTHYDAFRFFTPDARPRNALQPDFGSRRLLEQPGCLHAAMDVYKWAYKLVPMVPSELLMDCFELAKSIRALDMRASPYDLTDLGYPPVRIETATGKAEYVAGQRDFAERAQVLRRRVLAVLDRLGPPSAIEVRRPTTMFEVECPTHHDQGADQSDDSGDAV